MQLCYPVNTYQIFFIHSLALAYIYELSLILKVHCFFPWAIIIFPIKIPPFLSISTSINLTKYFIKQNIM